MPTRRRQNECTPDGLTTVHPNSIIHFIEIQISAYGMSSNGNGKRSLTFSPNAHTKKKATRESKNKTDDSPAS
jgi:hypothetical protein